LGKVNTLPKARITILDNKSVITILKFESSSLRALLKSQRCDIIDWHYDRGLNNSKLAVLSLITMVDGGMRVCHFNGVITTYGKWDCRNSWRYASLAVNRGAINRGFTVKVMVGFNVS
jgi:hypothetical protein